MEKYASQEDATLISSKDLFVKNMSFTKTTLMY